MFGVNERERSVGRRPSALHSLQAWLAALALIVCGLPLSTAQAQTLGRYEADFSLSDIDFVDTVGIAWEHGQVLVPVGISGREYHFLLDTGAGLSVVFSGSPLAQQMQRTGGASEAGGIISHDATGRTDTVPMLELPPMRLGRITLYGGRATLQQQAAGSSIDGILGFDLVNGGLSMKIDVPHRRLVISDRKGFFDKEEAAVRLKYTLNFHVPYIDIVPFGKHRERVLFDTGSRQFFSMNKHSFDEAYADDDDYPAPTLNAPSSTVQTIQTIPTIPTVDAAPATPPAERERKRRGSRQKPVPVPPVIEGRSLGRYAIGLGGLEPEGEVLFLLLNGLQIDSYTFSGVHALTTQGGSHLGAAVLEHGAVTFCNRPRLMLFQPVDEAQPHDVGNQQMEIAFVADELGRPAVGLVWEKSEPYAAGLRYGDVIEQIDNKPVLSLAQFVRWPFIRGQAHLFTVRNRQGQRRNVSWVRVR